MNALPRLLTWAEIQHLPVWRGQGFDAPAGSFQERLDASFAPVDQGFKRPMVQARQIYAHLQAAELGWGQGVELARQAFAFLRENCRDAAHDGWVFKISADGKSIVDGAKDLYTLAFILFALAWAKRGLGDPRALDMAEDLTRLLDAKMAHPSGGYHSLAERDWTPRADMLRQNPHMHLLEAFLFLYRADPRPIFRAHAESLLDLFESRLFDPESGTLGEYFDVQWRPDAAQGHRVEPGHHFEWAWLLHNCAKTFDRPALAQAAERLFAFARQHGFDPDYGGIFDEIDRHGRPVLVTKRIWPVCEFIKAAALRLDLGLSDEADLALGLDLLERHYLRPDGGWREHLDRDLVTMTNPALPGSSSYHILMALAEARRVVGSLPSHA